MSSNLNYRIASPTDIPQLNEFVNSAYRGETSKKGWTCEADLLDGQRVDDQMLSEMINSNKSTILLGFDAQQLFGCVYLENNQPIGYLGMLTIKPELQANGYGRKLLTAAEQWISSNWHAHLVEMTVIEQRTELIAWYQNRGYVLTDEIRPFPYGDERFGKPKLSDLKFVVLNKIMEKKF